MALGAVGRDLLLHGRRRRAEDGRVWRGHRRGRGRRRRLGARPGLRDPRPRRAAVRRFDGRRRHRWRPSRRSSRRGEPRGCRRWSRSATNPARCGSRRGRRCDRRSRGVSRAVSLADDGPREPDADLLTEFVAAARGAASFAEAFERALATLRDRLGAASAVLLEQDRPASIARSSRFRRMQAPRALAAGRRVSREPAPVLQLPAAVHDRRSRQLAALGARPLSRARPRRFRRCSTAAPGWRCRSGPRATSSACCCSARRRAAGSTAPARSSSCASARSN